MSATHITIVVKEETMEAIEGRAKGSRTVWRGAGIYFHVKGPLHGIAYEQACNLAMNMCEERHIPVRSLCRVDNHHKERRDRETMTKKMF